MKIAAFLCGILASAFAWAAGVFLEDLSPQFLALWPETISQQFLGLAVWHAIAAIGVVGGMLVVVSPLSGALLLLLGAAAWAGLANALPVGFSPQMIAPMALSLAGALAAFGAMVRGRARRATEEPRPSLEEIAREEALRLEPSELAVANAFDFSEALAPDSVGRSDVALVAPPPANTPAQHDSRDTGPPRGMSGLFAANVAVLVLLTGAVALLLYVEYRSGQLFAAFAPTAPRPALVSEGVPRIAGQSIAGEERATEVADAGATMNAGTPEPKAESDDATGSTAAPWATQGSAAPATADLSVPPHLEDLTEVATAPVTETASVADQEWVDPFAYCAAIGTIDFPDRRYAGPYLTVPIAGALKVPVSAPPDRVKWRCFEGNVMGCASFDWPICALTPSVSEMVEYCTQNPDARGLQAPNGSWSCQGTRPTIPPGENWPVDARGFLPGAWIVIPPSPAAATG